MDDRPQRLPGRMWAVLSCLIAGALSLSAGEPKPPEEKEAPKGPDHSVALNEEPGVLELLKKAQKAREKAELDPQAWPECVKHYSEILRKYPNTVYLERWEGTDPKDPAAMAWKNGLYKSTRERIAKDIASLPPGGLSIYRVINDPVARGLYADAAENFDERKMEQVAQEYFPTTFGDDALVWLGELAYQRGAARLALMRFNQALEHPSLSLPRVALLARKAMAQARIGDGAGSEKTLAELAEAAKDAKNGELLIGSAKGAEALSLLKERTASLLRMKAENTVADVSAARNWETYFGNAAHNALAPERKSVGLKKWSEATQKLLYGPTADEEPPRRIGDNNGTPIPDPTIPYNLTIRGDHFFLNDYQVLAAYPISSPRPGGPGTGNAVFFYPSDPLSVKGGGTRERTRRISRMYSTFVRHHPHFVTLSADRVFGVVGAEPNNQDMQMFGGGQETPQLSNYPIALTKSGKLQWALGADVKGAGFDGLSKADQEWMKSVFFASAPIYDNGVLYATAAKTSGVDEAWVCAFEAESGRMLWRTMLCSASPVLVNGPVQPDLGLPVAVSNNTVFVVTNLGAVAALDALGGGIKWLRVYDRVQATQDRFGRMGRGRTDFWGPNPPIVHEKIVICTPQDSEKMYAYDIETGKRVWEVERILPNDRDKLRHVLGIAHNSLVVTGNDVHFFGLKSGPEVAVIDQLESPIKGRGVVAGTTVLVPTEKSLLCIDTTLVENRVQAKLREQYKWADPEKEAGNVFVAGDVLYTISNTHVNAYFIWQDVAKKLQERIQKDEADFAAYLELSDTYLKTEDFENGLKLADAGLAAAAKKKDDPKVAPVLLDLNRKKYEVLMAMGSAVQGKEPKKAYEKYELAYGVAQAPGLGGELAVSALVNMAEAARMWLDFERALTHYTDLIEKYGDVTTGEAANQQRARVLAQTKIEEIKKIDPKAFLRIEAQAKQALDAAALDAAKLQGVVSLYPNADASGQALLKLGRLVMAKRPDLARQHLQRFLSRYGETPDAAGALALMGLSYEKGGLLGPAKDVYLRLAERPEFAAAKIAPDPLGDGAPSVSVSEWAKQKLSEEAFKRPLSSSTASLGTGVLKEAWSRDADGAQALVFDGAAPSLMRRNAFMIEKQGELAVYGPDGTEEWTPRPKLPAGSVARASWADHLLLFSGTREIVAFDSNERGRVAWRRELNIPNARMMRCSVQTSAGRVVVGYPSGGISVLDAQNGEILWQTQLDGNQMYGVPSLGDGFIAVAALNPARIYVFELDTGKKRAAIDQQAGSFAITPQAAGGKAYFAERNVVKAVDGITGKLVWEHTLGGEATMMHASREWVVVGGRDPERPVVALNTDGAGARKAWAPVLPRGAQVQNVYADGDDLLVTLLLSRKAALYSYSMSKQGKLNWEVELATDPTGMLTPSANTLAVGHVLASQANWDPIGEKPSSLVLIDRRTGKMSWSTNLSTDVRAGIDEAGNTIQTSSVQLFDGGILAVEGRKRTLYITTEARGDEDGLKVLKEQLAKNPADAKLLLKTAGVQFASSDAAQRVGAVQMLADAIASGTLKPADFNSAYAEMQRMRLELMKGKKARMEFSKAAGDVEAALKSAPETVLSGWSQTYLQRDDETIPFAREAFGGDADLKVAFRGVYDEKTLHLQFVVSDDVHKNEQAEGAYCDLGDSVRVVFDVDRDGGLGYRGDDFELCAALNDKKQVLGWRFVERGRYLGADAALNPAPTVVRDDAAKTTTYRFALPLEYLKLKPEAGTVFGFSFGVNDQDGEGGVKKSLSASPGVQRPPYPSLFGEGVLK